MSADATKEEQRDSTQQPVAAGPRAVPAEPRAIVAVVALLVAAWSGAGDLGLLIRPLADAITVGALTVALVAAWPPRRPGDMLPTWALLAAVVVGLTMIALAVPPLNVLAVALIAASLAWTQPPATSSEHLPPDRRSDAKAKSAAGQAPLGPPAPAAPSATARLLLLAAMAAATLAVFRLALDGIPTLWLLADAGSMLLGRLAGWLVGSPLDIGPTYAGVDYLAVMAVLYGGWLAWARGASPAKPRPAVWALPVVIFLGHLLYLIVLARTNTWLEILPAWVDPPPSDNSRFGIWTWSNALRTLLPWGLPMLAALIHATIAAAVLRLSHWLPSDDPAPLLSSSRSFSADNASKRRGASTASRSPVSRGSSRADRNQPRPSGDNIEAHPLAADLFFRFGPVTLGILLPLLIVAGSVPVSLEGDRILAYNEGYLNWIRPTYENIDLEPITSYGLLPWLVGSLGGQFATSDELTESELEAADVCLLIHPDRPWPEERLERLWDWVDGGGTLLLAAEPTLVTSESRSRFNEVLAKTKIRVREVTAVSAVRNWDQNYAKTSHPTTAGLGDRLAGGGGPGRNWFGYEHPATLELSWPARPLLLGRHAFAEPGSHAARVPSVGYDAGERLGDVILAAEQPHGNGRVIVLADASPLSNEMLMKSYVFGGRLLAYLAGDGSSPQAGWRQILGLLAAAVLGVALLYRPAAVRVLLAVIALAAATWTFTAMAHYRSEVQPQSEALINAADNAKGIAYIDAAHVNPYADDATVEDGLGLFAETLARNGYLPLLLPSFSEERLNGAELFVTIAPQRDYTTRERAVIERWVDAGGRLFVSTGAEQAQATNELLKQFSIRIPPSPVSPWSDEHEPVPLGSFNASYYQQGEFNAYVTFWDAWEVISTNPRARNPAVKGEHGKHVYGETTPLGRDIPVAVQVTPGSGMVTLFGDSAFLLNRTFRSNSQPHGNAYYWRWLLSHVDGEPWNPSPELFPDAGQTGQQAAGADEPDAGAPSPERPIVEPEDEPIEPDAGLIEPDAGLIEPGAGLLEPEDEPLGPDG